MMQYYIMKRQSAISKTKAKLIARLVNQRNVQKRINARLRKKLEAEKKRNAEMKKTFANLRRRGVF
jgi:hypothetical protein